MARIGFENTFIEGAEFAAAVAVLGTRVELYSLLLVTYVPQ